MRFFLSTFLITFLIFPLFSEARIRINEIAWMGTDQSANDEWIELYNDGKVGVVLDGWKLQDDVSLEINLAGTVGPGEYAVLERTDDSTVPGEAFFIYKGALSNKGRTLSLFNSIGEVEDEVVGGGQWSNIGGSNVSKETAQRVQDGWVSGPPTPGEKNKERVEKVEESTAAMVEGGRSLEAASVIAVQQDKEEFQGIAYVLLILTIILGSASLLVKGKKEE
jgi:hypothetical protein